MKRFKLFKSYHAEEKWLSEQARAGWRLVKKGVFYTFRRSNWYLTLITARSSADPIMKAI